MTLKTFLKHFSDCLFYFCSTCADRFTVAVRVVETLGAEKALELLYCTEDLQEAGGLMTMV